MWFTFCIPHMLQHLYCYNIFIEIFKVCMFFFKHYTIINWILDAWDELSYMQQSVNHPLLVSCDIDHRCGCEDNTIYCLKESQSWFNKTNLQTRRKAIRSRSGWSNHDYRNANWLGQGRRYCYWHRRIYFCCYNLN